MESSSARWEVTIKNIGLVVGLYYPSTRYLVYHRKKVIRYQASSTKAVHSAQITYDISILTYCLNNSHCLTALSQETIVHSVSAVLLQETQLYNHRRYNCSGDTSLLSHILGWTDITVYSVAWMTCSNVHDNDIHICITL